MAQAEQQRPDGMQPAAGATAWQQAAARARHHLRARSTGFGRGEDGAILVFGIVLLTTVLLLVGIGLDVMRFETERTVAQNTLDRAVLAAADLSQETAAQTVVNDYFSKAGLTSFTPVVTEEKGSLNEWKRVSGSFQVSEDTAFMQLAGIDTLSGTAAATAEERIGNVEISLVLDVSGSMSESTATGEQTCTTRRGTTTCTAVTSTKIAQLRNAAAEFVTTMFDNVEGSGDDEGKLSISVIPYAQQVLLGTTNAGYFNFSKETTASSCADFFDTDYTTTQISDTTSLPLTAYADARYSYSSPYFVECATDSWRTVLAFSSDETTIKSKISALQASGDTAIDIGAKWGLALLDPAAQPVVTNMIKNNLVDSTLAGRPYAYDTTDSMKIMVLMTDGENTNTYAVMSPYRAGSSPVWKDSSGYYYYKNAGYVSVRDSSSTTKSAYDYYAIDRTQTIKVYSSSSNYSNTTTHWFKASQLSGLTQQTWPTVWANYGIRWFAANAYAPATGGSSSTFIANAINRADSTTKDSRLADVCQAGKDNGVLVFAIAYEASSAGQAALKDCVSADAYYYDASGTTIADAFAGIASAITMLRLTQ